MLCACGVEEEPVIPDIPVVNLPEESYSDIVEETVESAVKEKKSRKKKKRERNEGDSSAS